MKNMKKFINNVNDLWDITFMIVILIVVCSCVYFIPKIGNKMFGDPTFNGYYTKSLFMQSTQQWHYNIYIEWTNGIDECAFGTSDINEFYKACDKFKVKIDPTVIKHTRMKQFEIKENMSKTPTTEF